MATAIERKVPCSTCQKATGIFTCRGCRKDFCSRHVAEHRQEINKQMDEVATKHDQLQQIIADQEVQPTCHPLMERIDEWEQQSVNKIHQTADDARKQALIIIDKFRIQVKPDLASLTTELTKARNEDDYVETDLKEWTEKLDKLKIDLTAAQAIDFDQDDDGISLVSKPFIYHASTDIFHQTNGDVHISKDRKTMIHGPSNEMAAAYCRRQYSLGEYRFLFKIERLSACYGLFCGIVSKSVPVDSMFTALAVNNMYGSVNTGYGVTRNLNHNVVTCFPDRNYQTNCTYEVLIDCNKKSMRLTNKQTLNIQETAVDLSKRPFPWQFFITLMYPNDCVSLC